MESLENNDTNAPPYRFDKDLLRRRRIINKFSMLILFCCNKDKCKKWNIPNKTVIIFNTPQLITFA